jgi:hypothetical protein
MPNEHPWTIAHFDELLDETLNAEDAVLKAAIDGDTASLIAHAGGYLAARLSAEKV